MENVDSQDFVQDWNPEESSITENTTEKLFHVTWKKRCCDETQKIIIALLKQWTRIFEVKKELEKFWKDITYSEIIELDKKRHEMARNNDIEQSNWEETWDNDRKRELIKELIKAREEKLAEKKLSKKQTNMNLEKKTHQTETIDLEKALWNQSLN